MNSHFEYIKKVNCLLDKAYVPYSKFPVAAIVIDENGNEYEGINVENASYGLGLCAERNAITTGITKGMKKISKVYITAKTERLISPCGACRQVISEFSTKDTKIILTNEKGIEYKEYSIDEILPYVFISSDLEI